ncbi:NUDIX hydrolase [Fibrobacterota bacterium]
MTKEQFEDAHKVKLWKKTVQEAGCGIEDLKPINSITKSNGELLFALAETQVTAGRRLMPYLLIRGHACVVVPQVMQRSSGEKKFIMVRQRRIGNGHSSLEFPAGMLDSSNDPVQVAEREFQEETGLEFEKGSLFPLHSGPLFSSPGLYDEGIFSLGCHLELEDKPYRKLENRYTGNQDFRLLYWKP